jgi:antitoxin VapB
VRETAKVFVTGRSQAVRLPLRYRFRSKEVFIRRDEKTGDVVLSERPDSWETFFALCSSTDIPRDFMTPADRGQGFLRPDPFKR